MTSSDAVPVAVQSPGETTAAEVVYTDDRAGEEEGGPRYVDVSAGPPATLLQLPPLERHENRLQKVATENTAASRLTLEFRDVFFLCFVICFPSAVYA